MKRRNFLTVLYFTGVVLLSSQFQVNSHPGRTDSNGGHYNRSTGQYHYHGAPYIRTTPTVARENTLPKPTFFAPSISTTTMPTVTPKSTDNAGYLINGKTYVPLRFVAESLGAQVTWDSVTRTALITKPGSQEAIMVPVRNR